MKRIDHLERLDRIVAALKANPLAPYMRIFGSALTADRPGDIDCFCEGPFDLDQETRSAAIRSYLALAAENGNYGSFDPFLLNNKHLFVRNDNGDAVWNIAWNDACRETAQSIIAAGRAGVPVLDFTRRFSPVGESISDMRDLIDIVSEHVVVDNLERNEAAIDRASSADIIGELEGVPVWRAIVGEDQEVYGLGQDDVRAYLILQRDSEGYWWALELYARHRGQGFAAKLIAYVVKNHRGRIFNDIKLTPDSIRMIERMVAKKMVTASIADLKVGKAYAYKPDEHASAPLYDRRISGIDRPPLETERAKQFIWVFEDRIPRTGILMEYIHFAPTQRLVR